MTMSVTRQDAQGFWLQGKHTEASKVDGQEPGSRRPSWNSSTTAMQTIRDALINLGASGWSEPRRLEGPVPDLERRPLDLGVGLWR